MFVASALLALSCVLPALALPLESRGVSTQVFDNLVFYFKYASSAYSDTCPRPNGNTLVTQINNVATDTQGFVARDDDRQEIVVSLRGSTTVHDFALTDINIILTDFNTPGVSAPSGTLVHSGFLKAFNSVSDDIISTVRDQLKSHPNYSVVTTGHSLGGALSSLAAVSLKTIFPATEITMYTYGQPRTGNDRYASWINEQFGSRTFRAVHTFDGVPTVFPKLLGFRHHGVEYWSHADPSSPATTRQCASAGEDPTCSDSILTTTLSPPHFWYYGIYWQTPFCQ